MILLIIKLLSKLQKFQNIHNKIIQRKLQMIIIKKLPKERYLFPEERQKNIDDLRLM